MKTLFFSLWLVALILGVSAYSMLLMAPTVDQFLILGLTLGIFVLLLGVLLHILGVGLRIRFRLNFGVWPSRNELKIQWLENIVLQRLSRCAMGVKRWFEVQEKVQRTVASVRDWEIPHVTLRGYREWRHSLIRHRLVEGLVSLRLRIWKGEFARIQRTAVHFGIKKARGEFKDFYPGGEKHRETLLDIFEIPQPPQPEWSLVSEADEK